MQGSWRGLSQSPHKDPHFFPSLTKKTLVTYSFLPWAPLATSISSSRPGRVDDEMNFYILFMEAKLGLLHFTLVFCESVQDIRLAGGYGVRLGLHGPLDEPMEEHLWGTNHHRADKCVHNGVLPSCQRYTRRLSSSGPDVVFRLPIQKSSSLCLHCSDIFHKVSLTSVA